MRKTYLVIALALLLVFAFAGTALAATPASDGGGLLFGTHHAGMAQDPGLTGSMNPGVHQGIVNWPMDMTM